MIGGTLDRLRRLVDAMLDMSIKNALRRIAEGLISKNSRDDGTPLELFLAGVRALPSDFLILTALDQD